MQLWRTPILLLMVAAQACLAGADAAPPTTRAQPADETLVGHLAAMKQINCMETLFVCEKRLAALDTPLVSSGTIWIRSPDSVRFTTNKPYLSDLILHDGQVLSRNQHDKRWVRNPQATRPGLAAVMGQMAKWSLGETQSMRDAYDIIHANAEVPPLPSGRSELGVGKTACFTLKPRDEAVAVAVRSILLIVDEDSHCLRVVRIVTAQGDQTTYWFDRIQLNAKLPADAFAPEDVK